MSRLSSLRFIALATSLVSVLCLASLGHTQDREVCPGELINLDETTNTSIPGSLLEAFDDYDETMLPCWDIRAGVRDDSTRQLGVVAAGPGDDGMALESARLTTHAVFQ